jgi:hypothetical protein
MQNWKLINNTAQTAIADNTRSDDNQADIVDSGFASFSHPKLKFNFTVDIELRVTLDGSGSSTLGSDRMESLDIPVKSATRPSPSIVYTDVNYYNYRTKVATKTDYGSASITFYDDADDKAQNLYKTYLNYVSPISNLTSFMTLDKISDTPFGQLSSIDMLPSNAAQGLIRVIRLHHFYKHRNKFMRTTYACMNPKINSFQPDELSMVESDVNTITLDFNYDGLNISTVEIP